MARSSAPWRPRTPGRAARHDAGDADTTAVAVAVAGTDDDWQVEAGAQALVVMTWYRSWSQQMLLCSRASRLHVRGPQAADGSLGWRR